MTEPPTYLDPSQDPLTVLRGMAKFASENRGIAEIRDGRKFIGYVVLRRQPETVPVIVYSADSRTVEHCMLADWLRFRGYEASASRWERIDPFSSPLSYIPGDLSWVLRLHKPAVPPLPEVSLGFGGGGGSDVAQSVAGRIFADEISNSCGGGGRFPAAAKPKRK